jgi:protein SCO1/2
MKWRKVKVLIAWFTKRPFYFSVIHLKDRHFIQNCFKKLPGICWKIKEKPMKSKVWLPIVAAIIGISLVAWWGIPRLILPTFHGTVIQSPNPAQDFSLISGSAQRVKLSDFRGKVVILYFGYTFCPDVCPSTLADLTKVMKSLGANADQVQVLMVTVDPERDDPEKIGQYVAHFDPGFIGLTGTSEQIAEVATYYGIYYAKIPGKNASEYSMEHTASLMVIDKKGYLRIVYPFGTSPGDISSDVSVLLR